ncbi:D-3-phosphoglycerate dehydrogenase [Hypoxylon sp. FL1150]|nr:D-3-phosphoglycerate dehydrogenase [Hypoxylon sp. FL1150]
MAPAILVDEPSSTEQTQSFDSDKPTVYVIDKFHPQAVAHARTLFNVVLHTDAAFANWQEKAEYILLRGSYLRASDIARCPRLLAVGKHGVGIDKIDAAACAARGIRILNTPGANAQAVAELVLALALAVARQIPAITARQVVEAVPKESCWGQCLHGKTVGVVGMGNIGRRVAKMFRGAFDAPVIAFDPYVPADAWADVPHRRVESYRDVLAEADVLTIHVPLTEETRDMIAYKELAGMKRTAILINASRGGIVNESDLEKALAESLIWGAGLDAHEVEPPTVEKYGSLWKLPNVVSTPHIGAATEDAQLMSALGAVDNLYNYIKTR